MLIPEICTRLQETQFATAIRESRWLFPTIETVHVLATGMVVGTITMLDLRLLNLASRDRGVHDVHEEVLPWTWTSFVCAAITGSLLFSSDAVKYYGNLQFRTKVLLLALLGLNAAIFEFGVYRGVAKWDRGRIPLAAKLAGGASLVFWICVVTLGRWIGFTTSLH
jgi:hypothetical protein